MKTTVDLPDDLFIRAKKRAVETRTPLRVLIERGLRRELASTATRTAATVSRREIKWVTASGGLPPGLDAADRASLWDWIGTRR